MLRCRQNRHPPGVPAGALPGQTQVGQRHPGRCNIGRDGIPAAGLADDHAHARQHGNDGAGGQDLRRRQAEQRYDVQQGGDHVAGGAETASHDLRNGVRQSPPTGPLQPPTALVATPTQPQ